MAARAALGLGAYGIVAGLVVALDLHALVTASLPLPAWVPFVLPPVLHALLAATWLPQRGPLTIALATSVLVGGHWSLVAITALVEMVVAGTSFPAAVASAAWGMPLLFALQLGIAPWALLPLGRALGSRTRSVAPLAGAPPRGRPAPLVPAGPPATSPMVSPLSGSPDAGAPDEGPMTGRSAAGAEPAAGPVAAPVAPRPSAEHGDAVVRIRFDRVAAQIPAAAFRLPLDRIAANLLEPEHLLIPQRIVASQLAEGVVRAAWDVVADQFPRQALALPDAEIARRIPGGALVLPLDEVVHQLPPDVFALSSPVADIRGIDEFPLPFQPHVPGGAAMPAPEAVETFPAGHEAGLEREAPGPPPSALAPPAPIAVEAPAPVAVVAPGPVALRLPPVMDDEPRPPAHRQWVVLPRPEPEALSGRGPEPDLAPPADEESAPPARPPAGPPRRLLPADVVAHLSPILGAVDVEERYVAGLTVVVAAAPGVEVDAAAATAGPILRFLADQRLPRAISQATLRAAQGSLVLTPLGVPERGGTVLVSAVAPGAPLAMVERAAHRVVEGAEAADDPGPGAPPAGRTIDGDLTAAAVPAHVRAVAESLRAFGRVTPAVLRDPAGTLLMYLFLPAEVDARLVAGYARDLRRHFGGGPLGTVSSFIARVGAQRLVVWELDAGRSCASVLVALGAVDRPGLARIELERAALRLAAL